MANLAITSMVIDPNDSSVIYAATGEGFGNLDALRGGGIFRTTNGATWTQVASTIGAGWDRVNRLAISADGVTLRQRRTRDAPQRRCCSRYLAECAQPGHCQSKVSPNRSAAGGGWQHLKLHVLVYYRRRSDMDRFDAWRKLGTRAELCYACAAPDIVYASADSEKGQIWRSTNGGQSFIKRNGLNQDGDPTTYLGDQGWYDGGRSDKCRSRRRWWRRLLAKHRCRQ
ncbi:hypothetical protein [Bradyrhizobium japonicum]|uniref:hypothetical protein n=1 Tax=Bradyrhizobium japonicum TaxID=375 RepID=UPI001E3F7F55|nr:hypothetical protein [Bradyrhizobium japonicum]MCD9825457.1 hypothetical protein [Bradyrhizobium japonicum]MCD9898408.1 hypothetical protein [Bradyrhizobium japonicum]MEB2671191.1 hypothetical protein [Bradyrhizobium japonicum]WLB28573.1 hypothetical protein QIH85_43500 [Bradyrhizobium japonicum]WRI90510.1 hypothetical protein R3F75_06065 [Bradyrhizobium japonicum]